jgi:hypothetical protein
VFDFVFVEIRQNRNRNKDYNTMFYSNDSASIFGKLSFAHGFFNQSMMKLSNSYFFKSFRLSLSHETRLFFLDRSIADTPSQFFILYLYST